MAGEKIFIGPKLREMRTKKGMTQAELAQALGVSASYINLIERNQRSASLKFLINLSDNFSINWRELTNSDTSTIIEKLRHITSDPAFGDHSPDIEELRAMVDNSPTMVKGIMNIYNAYRTYGEKLAEHNDAFAMAEDANISIEQHIHNFFRSNNNYFQDLEDCASDCYVQSIPDRQELYSALRAHLENNLGVKIKHIRDESLGQTLRYYDQKKKIIHLSDGLDHSNMVFQLAHMIALIEYPDLINAQLTKAIKENEKAAARCRIELANYFAAALMLPYKEFFNEVQLVRYDVQRLAARFSVSYEQICHRLTTLQRPGMRGIPFFFLRIDRGGNVSKRINVTPIQLARFGGTCPRLDIHYCFRVPERIITQMVEMPDHSRYFTINRTVNRPAIRFSTEDNRLAVSLGCPSEYASKLIYGNNLDLFSKQTVTKIGINCRLCPRHQCKQRAHDPFFSTLKLDENRRGITHFES